MTMPITAPAIAPEVEHGPRKISRKRDEQVDASAGEGDRRRGRGTPARRRSALHERGDPEHAGGGRVAPRCCRRAGPEWSRPAPRRAAAAKRCTESRTTGYGGGKTAGRHHHARNAAGGAAAQRRTRTCRRTVLSGFHGIRAPPRCVPASVAMPSPTARIAPRGGDDVEARTGRARISSRTDSG